MKKRILFVDDEANVLGALRRMLRPLQQEWDTGFAEGGAQALDLLASKQQGRRPDVIVMDLQMAPIDGIESTRLVRALYDDIEVVVLTSFAEEERVHAALQAGASGYVLKRSAPDALIQAVRIVAGGSVYLDPLLSGKVAGTLVGKASLPIFSLESRG